MKKYDIKTIKPLVDAASYLHIKSLADVCICKIATEYYIEPSMAGIEKVKQKFGIEENITAAKVKELKKEFPWIDELRRVKEENLKKDFK